MKKTPDTTEPNPIIIDIPNAMLYYRYNTLWNCFLTELVVKVIISEQTTKQLITNGSNKAIDKTYLSAQIYVGHIQSLIGKCDYILIPRISNWGRNHNLRTRVKAFTI